MNKITLIAGARPNFMKIAPIIHAIQKEIDNGKNLSYRLIHTGQHYDKKMSGDFFDQLEIPQPHANLESGGGTQAEQTANIMVRFEKELLGHPADVVLVVGDGSKAYSKERVEVYHQERTLVLDNWRKLIGYGFKNFSSASSGQDKGHQSQFSLLIESVTNGGRQVIPFDQIINTTKASFAAIESLRSGTWIDI